jgi:hypothetical protein
VVFESLPNQISHKTHAATSQRAELTSGERRKTR